VETKKKAKANMDCSAVKRQKKFRKKKKKSWSLRKARLLLSPYSHLRIKT
jgi:hypothetical protein